MAIARHDNDPDRLEELYLLAFEACGHDDLETLEELNEAIEAIEKLILEQPLAQVIGDIRTLADEQVAVCAGLHFLTGSGQAIEADEDQILEGFPGRQQAWRRHAAL